MSDTTTTVTFWAVMQDGNLTEPFTSPEYATFHADRDEAIAERDEYRSDVDEGASAIHIVRIVATITLETDHA